VALALELLRRSPAEATRAFDLVDDLLRASARSRAELLSTIELLAPLLRQLGGADEADAIARQILEVTRWWP
jgi:hypothetical protein